MVIKRTTGAITSQHTSLSLGFDAQGCLNALAATVIYADLFDYALTREEAHRYLIGATASRADVEVLLDQAIHGSLPIATNGQYLTLQGRENLFEIRERRAAEASRLWAHAMSYRNLLARIPFVRMLAITGTLAVDNTDKGGDIDLFVITAPGRLWLVRAAIIGVVKMAAARGIQLCPNYLVTENALAVKDRNIFTAHELAQMIPIYGFSTYQRMISANQWMFDYLPNATPMTDRLNEQLEGSQPVKSAAEAVLNTTPVSLLEGWEMRRKAARFARMKADAGIQGSEADFGPEWCKGHFQGHRNRTLSEYHQRLKSFGLDGVLSHAS